MVGDFLKNKRGYIYISFLILIIVSILFTLEFLDIIVNRRFILSDKFDKIRAFNSAESKILMAIGDSSYKYDFVLPYIQGNLKTKTYRKGFFRISKDDLLNEDKEIVVNLEFEQGLNRSSKPNSFIIRANSKVNFSKGRLLGDINIGNHIFTLEQAIIDKSSNMKEDIDRFFMEFENQESILFEPDNNFVSVVDKTADIFDIYKDDNNDLILLKDNEKYTYLDERHIRIFARNKDCTNIYIEKYEDIESIIGLSGIIYVNGNLIIRNNLEFDGIIIVENGRIVVDEGVSFINKGLIIGNKERIINITDRISLTYDSDIIFNMAPYLPGYIDLKINNIREE